MADKATVTAGRIAKRRGERLRLAAKLAVGCGLVLAFFVGLALFAAGNANHSVMGGQLPVPNAGIGAAYAFAFGAVVVLAVGVPLAFKGSSTARVIEASAAAPPVRRWGDA